jgi:hypothetical protein
MAKWSGIIGYTKIEEVEPGIWSDGEVIEHTHYGDTISDRNLIQQSSDSTNSNISLINRISIVADKFAIENFGYMKYAVVKGVKWKITAVEVQHPRFILTTGGLYNGK